MHTTVIGVITVVIVSARDEAIEELKVCDVDAPLDELVDALSSDVLLRVLEERGHLGLVGWAPHGGLPVHGDVRFEKQSDDDMPLYGVAP